MNAFCATLQTYVYVGVYIHTYVYVYVYRSTFDAAFELCTDKSELKQT